MGGVVFRNDTRSADYEIADRVLCDMTRQCHIAGHECTGDACNSVIARPSSCLTPDATAELLEATPTVAGGGPNCAKASRGDGYAEFCGAMVRLAPGRDGVVAAEIAGLAGGGASGGYSRPLRTAVMTASSLVFALSLLRRLRTWLRTV